jgi:hypothetical protein
MLPGLCNFRPVTPTRIGTVAFFICIAGTIASVPLLLLARAAAGKGGYAVMLVDPRYQSAGVMVTVSTVMEAVGFGAIDRLPASSVFTSWRVAGFRHLAAGEYYRGRREQYGTMEFFSLSEQRDSCSHATCNTRSRLVSRFKTIFAIISWTNWFRPISLPNVDLFRIVD